MGLLNVFNHVSLDGYFVDSQGNMDWAHRNSDEEWDEFVAGNARNSQGVMLFGRKTYELMVKFWPTPMAQEQMPEVARGMNEAEKVVFSRTMANADWSNTRLVKSDLAGEVRKLKESEKDLTVMGSGTIVSQLSEEEMVDQYQVVVNPLVLGSGRTMFEEVRHPLDLTLTDTRRFTNGNVLLTYRLTREG